MPESPMPESPMSESPMPESPASERTMINNRTMITEQAVGAEDRLRLMVILGSTRPERLCSAVADWFLERIVDDRRFSVDLCDLAELELPSDLTGGGDTDAFTKRIDEADAVVIITPEYNRGYPGVLKIAIDSVRDEWQAKPIGFVSYGGVSGGLRSVEQLRGVFGELHAVTLRDTVSIPNVADVFDDRRRLRDSCRFDAAAEALLRRLLWWGRVTSDALRRVPYPV